MDTNLAAPMLAHGSGLTTYRNFSPAANGTIAILRGAQVPDKDFVAMPDTDNTPFLSARRKMFVAGLILWGCLAAWTLSAFYQHLETVVPEKYFLPSAIGAAAGEFLALFFLFEFCFSIKLHARKWALFCSVIMAGVLLIHSGAVRGIEGARSDQTAAEQRYTNNAKKLIGGQNSRTGVRAANQATAKELKNLTQEGTKRIENSSIFPAAYIRDWMYSAIFIIGLLLFAWYEYIQLTDTTRDRNFNNVDDSTESEPVPGEA